MKLIDIDLNMKSRSDSINLYPLGDLHVGAYSFAEKKLREHVQRIASDSSALWFGGGDVADSIIFQDQARFDPANLPDWMLTGVPNRIRSKIKDVVQAQLDYAFELLAPIKHKCIGFLEGNHEHSIAKYHNRDIMSEICKEFQVPNLTDCSFLRLNASRNYGGNKFGGSTVLAFICHGFGGGRSPGSEPMHLNRLAQERDVELIMRGHSHTFFIMPAIPRLTIPRRGCMPVHATTHVVRACNWGGWLLSYAVGPSTYDSRANYPVRVLSTLVANIKPFKEKDGLIKPEITINEIQL